MARIVVGSYMVRYPLGGMLSWVLQYLTGFRKLGHDVYFVEKYGYPDSCYDPEKGIMSDDCGYGTSVVSDLLARHGLAGRWCFVARSGDYHGMTKREIEAVFRSADLFVDMGTHGAWQEESTCAAQTAMVDGEPGFTQIKMANNHAEGMPLPVYDHYFTTGKNIGRKGNPAPDLGISWRYLYHPVDTDLFNPVPTVRGAPYTTVMNWQSHQPIRFHDKVFGQKDLEFVHFLSLPKRVRAPFELAISGKNVPKEKLLESNWKVLNAHHITRSFDSFRDFITYSRGEFSVCKNVFVANKTAWFSDRSAAFLASGRPVVLQETGFSQFLPTGKGLFAVSTLEEAITAIEAIEADYSLHSIAAREIAQDVLESGIVLKGFLDEIGL